MKKINRFLLLVAVSFVAFACSKYDDGPALSFRSAEKRLSGLWEIQSLKIESIDYHSAYMADSVYLRFVISGTKEQLYIYLVEDSKSSSHLSTSALVLGDKNKTLIFGLPDYSMYTNITAPLFELVPAFNTEHTWDVSRLSMYDLWMSTTHNDSLYELEFHKIEPYILNQQ
jgi:hypothetical protein